MAPTTGDLMDLNANQASKEHSHAVVRDYISQPRLGMFNSLVSIKILAWARNFTTFFH